MRDAWRRLRIIEAPLDFKLGALLCFAFLLFASLGPLLVPHDPLASDFTLVKDQTFAPPGPSFAHWLGTDALLRDELARLTAGARVSLLVALLATTLSVGLGFGIGVISGLTSTSRLLWIDIALMRLADVLLALPFLLVVTVLAASAGHPSEVFLFLILGATSWTGTAKLVRAQTIQIANEPYVLAGKALGTTPFRSFAIHVLPNLLGGVLSLASIAMGRTILAEATLSYLNLGLEAPRASWGRMLHEAEPLIFARPALVLIPALAITLTVLSFHRMAEGIRAHFAPNPEDVSFGPSLPLDMLLVGALLSLALLVPDGRSVRGPASAEPSSSIERGGILHLATDVAIRTLDPALASDEASRPALDLLFARLVRFNEARKLVLELAASVENSSDGRVFDFVLREGVRLHDGSVLSADDVKRSFERLLSPDTPSPGASMYDIIEGASLYHKGKASQVTGIQVLDKQRVRFQLSKRDTSFLPRLALPFAAPVCKSMLTRATLRSPVLPCGAGPFRIESWDDNGRIALARHQSYFELGKPYLDGVEWTTGVPGRLQRYRFERGELDYTRDLSPATAALFCADERWRGLHRLLERETTSGIFLNTKVPPFDNRALRRAVSFAIDPSVLQRIRLDVQATSRVLPKSLTALSRLEERIPDQAHALEEMKLAGYEYDKATGRGGYPFAIPYITVPDSFDQQAAEIYEQQLRAIGIRVKLRLVSFATFLAEARRPKTSAMGWMSWGADFSDPSNFFDPTLRTSAIEPGFSQNQAFFSNAELDSILDLAHEENDPIRRAALYDRAEHIVREEAPWIPTYSLGAFEIWQRYLQGYPPEATALGFREVWLRPRAEADSATKHPFRFGFALP